MKTYKGEVMIVDDTDANRQFLRAVLTNNGYAVQQAINGKMALIAVKVSPPDLILLDILMPEIDGFEVCRQLKADPVTCDIPIIFISALEATEDKIKAFSAGGIDYITKPFEPNEVLVRVTTHLKLRAVNQQLHEANVQLREEIAIRTRMEDELRRRQHVMRLLNEISHNTNNAQDYQLMFQALADNLGELFGADGCYITQWDDELKITIPLAAYGPKRGIYPTLKVKANEMTATEAVLQAGHTIVIEDVNQSPFISPESTKKNPSRSMLVLPLFANIHDQTSKGKEPLGALVVSYEQTHHFKTDEIEFGELAAEQIVLAITKAKLMAQSSQRASEFHTLYKMTQAISGEVELPVLLYLIAGSARDLLSAMASSIYEYDLVNQVLEVVVSTNKNPSIGTQSKRGEGLVGKVAETKESLIVGDYSNWEGKTPDTNDELIRAVVAVPLLFSGQLMGVLVVYDYGESNRKFSQDDAHILSLFALQAAAAIHSARLFTETRAHLGELNRLSTVFQAALTTEEMLPRFLDEALTALHAADGCIWLLDGEKKKLEPIVLQGVFASDPAVRDNRIGDDLTNYALLGYESFVSHEVQSDHRLPDGIRNLLPQGFGGVLAPISTADEEMGILMIAVRLPREVHAEEAHFLSTLAEMVGNAIQRMRLHQLTERRLHDLQALREIDKAISVSLDVRVTLGILLEQTITRLNIDAASVLLFKPADNALEFAAGRGFRTSALRHTHLRLGEGYAGQAAIERRVIHVPDMRGRKTDFLRSPWFVQEDFVTSYAVPLIAKGELKGVLEVFHRELREPDDEWIEVLGSLATQAAIALDNADMFEGLQRSNLELLLAYETTIEGWAKALDLREHETGQHTQRVTALSELLARVMGVDEEDITQIRRGALLHDIGKMGVPDSILLKPGKLTTDEWRIMRRHPDYAYEMLRPIEYLRPAMDIPCCHHEKWDGSGYPRGLKGERIPLAARIFAVVDVWDALTSDRPYRKAMLEDDVCEYLLQQSGKHFDPQIVKVFVNLMRETETEPIVDR